MVQFECNAEMFMIRPAPVQTTGHVPLKSVARDMACAKLQSKILSVQAAKLHHELPPEQQATMLSAGDAALARIGQPCTSPRQR